MDIRISSIKLKILLESNPLKSRILVRILAGGRKTSECGQLSVGVAASRPEIGAAALSLSLASEGRPLTLGRRPGGRGIHKRDASLDS